MSNYTDFLDKVIDDDGLVTNINYNFQESPSTQQYHSVAARDNPDYAQAIGDIYRWGDVNRAKFNLGLDFAYNKGNKDYLEKTRDEQRAYAEKLRNEQRAYNEKQQAKAWARADALRKEQKQDQLDAQRFQLGLKLWDRMQQTPRDIAGLSPYRTNNTNINIDLDELRNERQNLIDQGNNLFNPENLSGNSPYEMLYNALVAERQHQQAIKDYEAKARNIRSNYQEDLLRNAANNSYLGATPDLFGNNRATNVLTKNDDRSYAAKLISNEPFRGLFNQNLEAKAETLQDFMHDYNALDAGGWTNHENDVLASSLRNAGYDLTNLAPLVSYDEQGNLSEYIFDASTGTIYEVGENDNTGSVELVPIKQTENLDNFSLGRMFKNLGRDTGVINRKIMADRPDNFGE